ncbi:MAG TPA: multicopper oxidase domain-containing protein [Candidatus Udaeobacter sp.]|nr:multicopper oxidase domain-containing protein [Candidatus Udaeobacter sp.]
MKTPKYVISTVALVVGIFGISLSARGNDEQKISPQPSPSPARTRTYYIAAENTDWNYAPTGKDQMTGKPVPAPWGKQLVYKKVRYFEYTDDTFTEKKPQPPWLGILGPIIRGVEGDTIKVVFYNKANKPYSMHPHGLRYDKDNEGATHDGGSDHHHMNMASGSMQMDGAGAKVAPGHKYTYTWTVPHDAAPTEAEGGSKIWMYHSHVNGPQDVYDGLIGPIIVTSAAHARADGTPDDVDKEFVTMFMIFNESKPGMTDKQKEPHLKHAINGYIFANLPGLDMNKGDRVRWHLIGMGNEIDLHTPHWHATLVKLNGTYTDVAELLPASMKSADMLADNPGEWMYHCHVADHIIAGMTSMYRVHEK